MSRSADAEPTTTEISSPFTRWFDSDGYFVAKPFQQWIASEISIVGDADPKSVEAAKKISEGYVELADGETKIPDVHGGTDASGKETPSKNIRER